MLKFYKDKIAIKMKVIDEISEACNYIILLINYSEEMPGSKKKN